jgi:hypothetical protein
VKTAHALDRAATAIGKVNSAEAYLRNGQTSR